MEEDSVSLASASAEGRGTYSALFARDHSAPSPVSVLALPIALLDTVFSFLPVGDLRTVLGVHQHFYRAAIASDRTAWRDACLTMWESKQGFGQFSREWPEIVAAHRCEELCVIAMQQRLVAQKHFDLDAVCDWDDMVKDDEAVQHFPSPHCASQVCASSYDSCCCSHWWSHQESQSLVSRNGNVFTNVCEGECVACESPHVCGSAASVHSTWRTPTYDVISRSSNGAASSRFMPLSHSSTASCKWSDNVSSRLCVCACAGSRLHCRHFAQERQRRGMQRHVLRKQQQGEAMSLLLLVNGDGEHEEEEEESEGANTIQFTSSTGTISLGHPSMNASQSITSPQSDAKGNEENESHTTREHDVMEESIHSAKTRGGPCRDCEENRTMTRPRSLLLNTQYSRNTLEHKNHTSNSDNSHLYPHSPLHCNSDTRRVNPCGSVCVVGPGDDAEVRVPVSWKFAYHMSLRDARRVRLTREELLGGRWFVCFRATGLTHAASFAANDTVTVHAAGGAPGDMPPFACRLLQRGAELAVHNFPPLKVRRRHGRAASSAKAKPHAETAGDAAFDAEPVATLRRLGLMSHSGGEEDAEDDWGWVAQNYFVKIFSVETPVPWYVHRLGFNCGAAAPPYI